MCIVHRHVVEIPHAYISMQGNESERVLFGWCIAAYVVSFICSMSMFELCVSVCACS